MSFYHVDQLLLECIFFSQTLTIYPASKCSTIYIIFGCLCEGCFDKCDGRVMTWKYKVFTGLVDRNKVKANNKTRDWQIVWKSYSIKWTNLMDIFISFYGQIILWILEKCAFLILYVWVNLMTRLVLKRW